MKIPLLLLMIFFLSSCNSSDAINKNIEKNTINKNLNIKKLWDFWNNTFLEKSWIQKSRETIIINSNVYWTIWKIELNEWDKVSEWEVIVIIKDNIKDYWINIEKSNNTIEKLDLKYKSTELNYEKQINKINNNISKLEVNLINLEKNRDKTLEDIDINIQERNISDINSKSNLELKKINESIDRLNLEFVNQKNTNLEELDTIKNWLSGIFDAFEIWSYDIIYFSDEILWVTKENRHKNDSFDDYIGVKSSILKNEVKNQLKELLKIKETLSEIKLETFEEKNIEIYLDRLSTYYNLEKNFLNNLEILISEKSITSKWTLEQTDIDSYTGLFISK